MSHVIYSGCQSIVRSGHGIENTLLAATHMSLRHSHVDDFKGEKATHLAPVPQTL